MTGAVSERIHDRISFVKGDWLIEGQEIQDDRMIGRIVSVVMALAPRRYRKSVKV